MKKIKSGLTKTVKKWEYKLKEQNSAMKNIRKNYLGITKKSYQVV